MGAESVPPAAATPKAGASTPKAGRPDLRALLEAKKRQHGSKGAGSVPAPAAPAPKSPARSMPSVNSDADVGGDGSSEVEVEEESLAKRRKLSKKPSESE